MRFKGQRFFQMFDGLGIVLFSEFDEPDEVEMPSPLGRVKI